MTGDTRLLGLAIGLATGPSGGYAQSWSGIADGRWHVWLIMTLVGGLLGVLTLPLFVEPDASGAARVPLPFLALFGFAVAVVAGTFAAFPAGAALGALGGAAGAVVAGLVWRVRRLEGRRLRLPLTAILAALGGWAVVATWLH